jgi:hypothetical protein
MVNMNIMKIKNSQKSLTEVKAMHAKDAEEKSQRRSYVFALHI